MPSLANAPAPPQPLELASAGHVIVERQYLQISPDNGPEITYKDGVLPGFAIDAEQWIYNGSHLVSEYHPEEWEHFSKAIVSIRHGALLQALVDTTPVVTDELHHFMVALRRSDIFPYVGGHVTASQSPKSTDFCRYENDQAIGVDEYHFYLPSRLDLRVAKVTARGSRGWWGKYRLRYFQMDDAPDLVGE